jgi:YD repeat-containing protein
VLCSVKWLFIFLCFSSLTSFGQMLDNTQGAAFTDRPFFSIDFIRSNKIKELKGTFTYKKPGEVMRATTYEYVYSFDVNGRLISTFETRKDDGTKDTTGNIYTYDANGRLSEHKIGDGKGYSVTLYDFDEQGRIVRETYSREYRDTLGVWRRTEMNSETMRYAEGERQQKRTVYNSYGLPYMEEFTYSNELGYIVKKEQRLLMTGGVSTMTYSYNDKGLLSSLVTQVYGEETPSEELHFTYDQNGNLEERRVYREGKYITEFEIIYNEKSRLLKYVITRDVKSDFLMILGFKEYFFY